MPAAKALAEGPLTVAARAFRIAVFSYGLPTPGEKRGGIEQVAHDLANAFADRGHEVTVFTYDRRPPMARYTTSPLPARAFVTSWLGRRVTMGYLGNLLALSPGYADADVIVAHGDSLLLPLLGKPVIRVMHGSAREEARSATSIGRTVLQYGVYLQELLTARWQRGTVGVSENTRRSNRFVRRVIPNGVDLSIFRPDPARRSAMPSMLFVGTLEGRKRGRWLLDAFVRDILPSCPEAQLHLVTPPGPELPGVHYHTGATPAELVRLYQSAWVYASPSTYEGFGLPYVEAMACGTPVVATPNPGSLEVLADGTWGCVVNDGDFASTVCRVLTDGALRARLGSRALERAAHFDIAQSAQQYEALIEELVGTHA